MKMSILICPECGAENSLTAERCWQCDLSLTDVPLSDIMGSSESSEDDFDLLAPEENDLPGLLHALKEDGDISETADGLLNADATSSPSSPDVFGPPDSEDAEDIPDWLQRIRKRANEEPDSVGEITQKMVAAKESLEEEKSETQHENFTSWIQKLRDPMDDQPAEAASENELFAEPEEEPSDVEADWLSKIRKAHGKPTKADAQELSSMNDQGGDSLLQWLVALEEGVEQPMSLQDDTTVDNGDVGEDTRQTRIDISSSEVEYTQELTSGAKKAGETLTPILAVSREEQLLADQLSATIMDEQAARPARHPVKRNSMRTLRWILSILLIAALTVSFSFSDRVSFPKGGLQPHNEALLSWMEALPPESSLLLIFDFQPGYSSELSLIAKPLMEIGMQKGAAVSILSSSVSGHLLAERLLNEMDWAEVPPIQYLGYFPVAAYGGYGLVNQLSVSRVPVNFPKPVQALPTEDFDGVLILSDNYDGARGWIEQLSSPTLDFPIYLIVTAQAGPLLMPYWESSQVSGMVSGFSEAIGLEALSSDDVAVASRWTAYQVGVLLLIALMLIGTLFNRKGELDTGERGAL